MPLNRTTPINQTYYAGKSFTLAKAEKRVAALVPLAMLDRLAELETFYAQTKVERSSTDLSVGRLRPPIEEAAQ